MAPASYTDPGAAAASPAPCGDPDMSHIPPFPVDVSLSAPPRPSAGEATQLTEAWMPDHVEAVPPNRACVKVSRLVQPPRTPPRPEPARPDGPPSPPAPRDPAPPCDAARARVWEAPAPRAGGVGGAEVDVPVGNEMDVEVPGPVSPGAADDALPPCGWAGVPWPTRTTDDASTRAATTAAEPNTR